MDKIETALYRRDGDDKQRGAAQRSTEPNAASATLVVYQLRPTAH